MECCRPTSKLPFVPLMQVCPSVIHFSWNLQVDTAVVHHVHGPLLRKDERHALMTHLDVCVCVGWGGDSPSKTYHDWNLIGGYFQVGGGGYSAALLDSLPFPPVDGGVGSSWMRRMC